MNMVSKYRDSQIVFYTCIFCTYFFVIFFAYRDIFTLPFVQDDAYGMIVADDFVNIYKGIWNAFQYRPNGYLISKIIKTLLGESVLTMRMTSLLIHSLNCTLVCMLSEKLTKVKEIGFFAGLLFALHTSMYFVMNAYLAAVFVGFAIAFGLVAIIFFSYSYSKERIKILPYSLSMLFAILAIFTYEAAVMVFPIIFFALLLDIFDFKNAFKSSLKIIKIFFPCAAVCVLYLLIKFIQIKANSESLNFGAGNSYTIGLSAVFVNAKNLLTFTFWSLSYINDTMYMVFVLQVLVILVYFCVIKRDKYVGILLTAAFMGFVPFLLLDAHGIAPYYPFISAICVCMLFPYVLYSLVVKLKSSKIITILYISVYVFYLVFMVHSVWKIYPTHGLTQMAATGKTITEQFNRIIEDTNIKNRKIYFINIDFATANTFFFGDSINFERKEDKFDFFFDYMHKIEDMDKDSTTFIYIRRDPSNTFSKTIKLMDVTMDMKSINNNSDIPTEKFETMADVSIFKKYYGESHINETDIVYALKLEDTATIPEHMENTDYLFMYKNDLLKSGVLLINIDGKFYSMQNVKDGTIATLANMGEWDEASKRFKGEKIICQNGIWKINKTNNPIPYKELNSASEIGNLSFGTSSNNNNFEVIKQEDYLRICIFEETGYLCLLEGNLNSVPITIKGTAKSKENVKTFLQTFNFSDSGEFIATTTNITENNNWQEIFETVNFSASDNNYVGIGIFETKQNDYFDIKSLNFYKGLFFKESFSTH